MDESSEKPCSPRSFSAKFLTRGPPTVRNPFAASVAMLLLRIATKMFNEPDSNRDMRTIQTLVLNILRVSDS